MRVKNVGLMIMCSFLLSKKIHVVTNQTMFCGRKAQRLEVSSLAQLAKDILQKRIDFKCSLNERHSALQDILQAGSSAGGARPKALVSWNQETNEARAFGDFAREAGVPGKAVDRMVPHFRIYPEI